MLCCRIVINIGVCVTAVGSYDVADITDVGMVDVGVDVIVGDAADAVGGGVVDGGVDGVVVLVDDYADVVVV